MPVIEEAILERENEMQEEICPKKDSCEILQQFLREIEHLRTENENLRRVFETATLQFAKKNHRIERLETELERVWNIAKEQDEKIESLEKRLQEAEAKNNLLNKIAFGRKSEKKESEQPHVTGSKKRGAVNGHTGHGRKIPENLPEREEIIDIPEDEKFCSCCGKPYVEIGLEEVSSEVGVEKIYYLKKIKRKVYKKTCDCPNPIVTTPVPSKLIPKGKFSTEFWVDVLINKFKNHLPIERQISDMKEYGLNISAGTIFGGFKKIHSLYLKSLYEAMARGLREASHWHADESRWHLFAKVDEKGNYNWFIWVFISKDIVLFVLHPTRSAKVPFKTLFDIEPEEIKVISANLKERKVISVDKFSSYKMLERLGLVKLAFCWAHQRREFIDVQTKYPETAIWADEWIERIGNLYHINNRRIKYNLEDSIFKERDQKLKEKISEVYSLINMEYGHPGEVAIMNSMREHWKGLTLFVDNPEIPMDNNISERMLRHMVLGRKNYWGNHATWAGELTVAMFSIIQTSLLHGISPRAYLTYYLTECAKKGGSPSEDEIESFLPHKLSEDTKIKLKSC